MSTLSGRAWTPFNESLRRRLLLRLAALLCVLLALDALACYYTSWHFANLVYDRWLVDSNRSLATVVHMQDGQIVVDLPQAALEVFQFDAVDITYYRIDSNRRGYIAGEKGLAPIYDVPVGEVRLGNSTIDGRRVRIVSGRLRPTRSGDSPIVSVAETLIKRSTLTREILLVMVAPQAALLLAALVLAWINVNRGLKPLTDLADAIQSRGHENLTPVAVEGLPTEARILASRLNELFARVGAAMQAQERFVGDAAHQLRTPLASLVLHAEAAERAGETQARRGALRNLRAAAERAARLSQQLLVLMRAGPAAAAATHFTRLDLTALVRHLGEEWVPQMLAYGIDFGLAVPEHPVEVEADGALLGELLSNLLDNARRYGRSEGRVTLGLQLHRSPNGRTHATVYVEDDGPGIAPGEIDRIFERFYRAPGTSGEGCGLGLAIVRQIAELHGAALEAISEPGIGGSRFTITFEADFAGPIEPLTAAPA
ncbi:MAG TPA: sensor histidine kinase N-terminal domain-containing protein [Steroidobacteraceae bacterium]|jgi:two-component system sensor histidine kinase TctE|nr:sensor histidine kinase N-terminal domain-containing protein [Steroidobacteraceae bacterium]